MLIRYSYIFKSEDANFSRDYSYMISYSFNFKYEKHISELLSLSLEPGYIQKGSNSDELGGFRINVNYMNLPLFLTIDVFKNYSITIGPEVSYLLSTVIKQDGERIGEQLYKSKIQLGGAIGFSKKITNTISGGVRYSMDVTSLYESYVEDMYSINNEPAKVSIRNNYFQLYLTYYLRRQ